MNKICPVCFREIEVGCSVCKHCGLDMVKLADGVVQTVSVAGMAGMHIPNVIYTNTKGMHSQSKLKRYSQDDDNEYSNAGCFGVAIFSLIVYAALSAATVIVPADRAMLFLMLGIIALIAQVVFVIACVSGIVNSKLVNVGKRLERQEKLNEEIGKRLDLLEKENERLKSEQTKTDEEIK